MIRGILWVVIGLWLLPLYAADNTEETQRQKQQQLQQLQQLRQQIAELEKNQQAKRSQYAQEEQQLRTIDIKVGAISRAIRKTTQQIAAIERDMQQLSKRIAKEQVMISRQQELLGKQIRSAYMSGRQEYLKLLLNQEEPEILGRLLTYYRYFNNARVETIAEIESSISHILLQKKQLAQAKQESLQLQQQQQQQQKELTDSKTEREQVMRRIRREIAKNDKQLDDLQQNEKALQQVVEQLEKTLQSLAALQKSKAKSFARLKGSLRWPAQGSLLHKFGSARQVGKLNWNGVVIGASEGTVVKAVAAGRVVYADWLRGYGLLLIIDHGDGYMSLYGHNQTIYKDVGDEVSLEETIAQVGKSGGMEDNSLYFEIRHKSRPVNPATWCKKF